MSRYLCIVLLTLLCPLTGYGQKNNNDKLPVINVADNLRTYRKIPMSDYFSEIDYVKLETERDFMIGRTDHIIVTDTRIFIGGFNYCYAFTRGGEFISDVGRVGRGPGEWPDSISEISIDEKNRRIYIDTYHKICEYTYDGGFVREFKKPTSIGERGNPFRVENATFFRDNLFLGHVNNRSGRDAYNWVIFDDKGLVVKTFENHLKLDKEAFTSAIFDPTIIPSESTYLKEGINDTLFVMNKNNHLSPEFIFDLGRHAFPTNAYMSFQNILDINSKAIIIRGYNMHISLNNIFFELSVGYRTGLPIQQGVTRQVSVMGKTSIIGDTGVVSGIYDITVGKTVLLDRDPITRSKGLINDIDGGLSFWPRYYNYSDNELVQVLEAYEMKNVLTEEYFAVHPAKDLAAHAHLRTLLENLKEDDNPIIVVAKLKK